MFFNNFFRRWSKLPWYLYVSYRVCGQYITMLFSQKVTWVMIFNKKIPSIIVTTAFVHKLSGTWCVYCRVIFTEVIGGKFFKNFFPLRKVIAVFVPRLSDLRCVWYHPIYTEVIGVIFFNQLFFPRKVTLCLYLGSVIRIYRAIFT